ncbi:hypothetical protein EV421DRAFT_1029995 [Armillaria borealis]|uniref:Uncharacterized protein n=1 Tax=Armillaria borealis TaxID=47425 RepID=A0AA39J8N4_9AGAR|nr:hypothetical protein EV421DRAFT_1029995 [Armillaria borealis]
MAEGGTRSELLVIVQCELEHAEALGNGRVDKRISEGGAFVIIIAPGLRITRRCPYHGPITCFFHFPSSLPVIQLPASWSKRAAVTTMPSSSAILPRLYASPHVSVTVVLIAYSLLSPSLCPSTVPKSTVVPMSGARRRPNRKKRTKVREPSSSCTLRASAMYPECIANGTSLGMRWMHIDKRKTRTGKRRDGASKYYEYGRRWTC